MNSYEMINHENEVRTEELQREIKSYEDTLKIVRNEADEIHKRNTELLEELKKSKSFYLDLEQLIGDYKRINDSQRFMHDCLLEQCGELEKLLQYKNSRINELIVEKHEIDKLNYDLEIEICQLKERIKNPTFIKECR